MFSAAEAKPFSQWGTFGVFDLNTALILILLPCAGGGQLVEKVQRGPGCILVVEAFHDDALKTLRIGGSL